MSDDLERDIQKLRKRTDRLPGPEPSAAVDEAIRQAARRKPRRRLAPVAAVAASVALAALLVPQLLQHLPAPDKQESARKQMPVQTVAAPAPPEARARALAAEREDRTSRARVDDRLKRELHALEHADRPAWRERLLALRARGDHELADTLLAAYRLRFEEPDDFGWKELEQTPP